MNESVQIYYGEGKGKTAAALGYALRAASCGKSVIVIQFLKGKNVDDYAILKRLEPEIRLFCFEKSDSYFADLTEEEQAEEATNIRNAMNYAKKVLSTRECDLLVLDEVLGLIDEGLATGEEVLQVLSGKTDSTEVILTGLTLDEKLREAADAVYKIEVEKA